MANPTAEEYAEAAKHYGIATPEQQPAQPSPEDFAQAAAHYGIPTDRPQQQAPVAEVASPDSQDFFAQLGGLAHGAAQGVYRSADVLQAPVKGLGANLYRAVTGKERRMERRRCNTSRRLNCER